MLCKEIQPRMGKIEISLTVIEKEEVREFEKFGKTGRVCNLICEDKDGDKIKVTLWNEEIDKVNAGDKIKIINGYCSEFQGEKQLSAGKYGKLEVL